ncbi:cytochrome c biogenesis CcdA family protein [Desulfoluna butyratoxydans]|uniref:Cytochrome c biogenesis protein transmembrane domain n=1 Tax=Desulfoluna butyratoxydans TaxID=231438 RepID=A0A4U8YLI4_9BACT|nr:cytochrome c biogenesis protein CcdA [Desulfoluna butyratoxydans]VFQ44284.1 cytochrome c biogenesis protein transmembrane domain [Desulfoluna butyratoxydans]
MTGFLTVSWGAAFAAGLLSFFSPCVLPLVPAYFTFITGLSLEELHAGGAGVRKQVILATLAYVSGFSLVFVLLGAAVSSLGGLLYDSKEWLRIGGGILVILFGLHFLGLLRVPSLQVDKRLRVRHKPLHLFGVFVVGMAFGAGWSPCIGPMLGSILVLAGNQETVARGMGLLTVYSAGLALPFVLISVFIHAMLNFMKKARKVLPYVNKVAGVLLVAVGILLLGGYINALAIP